MYSAFTSGVNSCPSHMIITWSPDKDVMDLMSWGQPQSE